MKIAVCGSMVFTDKMIEVKHTLENLGYEVFVSNFVDTYSGKSQDEIQILTIKDKMQSGGLIEFCEKIKESDFVLAMNYDKNGIKNYIGGNTLIELGYAFILGKKIFLLNPIPEIPYYKSEIEAMFPIILDEDINKISTYS